MSTLTPLLGKDMADIINGAASAELQAVQFYTHLSVKCQAIGLLGAAAFFESESMEERRHFRLHQQFMNDLNLTIEIRDLDAEDIQVTDLETALKAAYDVEVDLLGNYNRWQHSAHIQMDYVLVQHLWQFIEIQRKSVGEYGDWLNRLERAGDTGAILIDQELGEAAKG